MEDRIRAAKQQIEQAFAGVEYPRGKAVVSDADGKDLVLSFTDKHWRDIAVETLTYSSLYFFTKEGFQFFLPAFLLGALDEANGELRTRLVRALAPREPGDPAQEAAFQERIGLCTPSQRAAIRDFLAVVAERYADDFTRKPPALAADGFWLRGDAAQ